MNRITYEDNAFIFSENDNKTVLFRCDDFLSNKSRLPMHSLDESLTIPQLIVNLINSNAQFFENHQEKTLTFATSLVDIITAGYISKTALPVKVAELGATEGIISFHLAALLGKFHPGSLLCCISDTMGNDSDNQWLDRIVLAEEPPQLSFLAADYEHTQLQESSFDIVVINGMVNFMNPYQVIQEAKRLVKNHGLIICCSFHTPLLESSFKIAFKEKTEYSITETSKIMVTYHEKDACNLRDAFVVQHEEICSYIRNITQLIKENEQVNLEKTLDEIHQFLKRSANLMDIDAKIQLLNLEETLLDYMINNIVL